MMIFAAGVGGFSKKVKHPMDGMNYLINKQRRKSLTQFEMQLTRAKQGSPGRQQVPQQAINQNLKPLAHHQGCMEEGVMLQEIGQLSVPRTTLSAQGTDPAYQRD
mmetsp:Transcript_11431/g.15050  ORF Transcript_11431/g.15050 Transcript_11431/m.15050 type:complete len:105 (-) Transcript_11431:916-1230(-)